MAKTKTNPIADAHARCKPGRDALIEAGARCMESVEDRAGIVCERYLLPNGRNAVLFATPHWWDVFVPATDENRIDATIAAIKAAAQPV